MRSRGDTVALPNEGITLNTHSIVEVIYVIIKGFKLGMMLQLAIGPVCVFIFKVGGDKGLIAAELAVLGVVLIDALYIMLAISGITSFVEKERIKYIFKIFGAVIVAIFGLNIIFGTFGWEVIPNLNLFDGIKPENAFFEGLVLTASNPLTILFWAGVFSAKIVEGKLTRKDVCFFGLGSVLATIFFLTAIAVTGSITRYFLPVEIISTLNFIVGLSLVYFAFRMFTKKDCMLTLVEQERWDDVTEFLLKGVNTLYKAGADFGIISANTHSHRLRPIKELISHSVD